MPKTETPTARLVTDQERRSRIGVRHALAGTSRVFTPDDAARSVVCLHATDPPSVHLSCWARSDTVQSRARSRSLRTVSGMLHHEFDQLMAAETEELERLTANRDRLESEQDRLMQAHYADAIPLSVLKREQDRIVAELDQVTRRIDAHFGDALGLLANCADIYARCDDTNRRLCNQAFFTKVFIDEDNELRVEHNRPFEMLLDRRSTPTL